MASSCILRDKESSLEYAINKIKMASNKDRLKTWLLVEASTDIEVFGSFVDDSQVKVLAVTGRDNVDAGVRVFSFGDTRTVFGIADADHDIVFGSSSLHDRVFTTDYRDLEVMMFFSDCGKGAIRTYLKHPISNVLARDLESLINRITSELAKIGACRVANQMLGLGLNFRNVLLVDHMESRFFTIDLDAYIESLFVNAVRTHNEETQAKFRNVVTGLMNEHHPQKLVPGHDLTKYLAALFSSDYGKGFEPPSESSIERTLRICYAANGSHFAESQLCRRLAEHVPLSQTVWQHLEKETA